VIQNPSNRILEHHKDQRTGQVSFYSEATRLTEEAIRIVEAHLAVADGNGVAVIIFDLDRFWIIMESTPSETIERFLTSCEELLRNAAPAGEAVSLGRDEFLLVIPVLDLENSLILAEDLRARLAQLLLSWAKEEQNVEPSEALSSSVGCSAGVSLYPKHGSTAVELVRAAEEALFGAKSEGRNRTKLPSEDSMVLKSSYYTPVQLKRLQLLADHLGENASSILRQALDAYLAKHDF